MGRQVRIFEIGIASRIGHNLARYKAAQSDAYTPFRFSINCLRVMKECGIARVHYKRLMKQAVEQMNADILALSHGLDLSSDGGSACTAEALLIGPIYQLLEAIHNESQVAMSASKEA